MPDLNIASGEGGRGGWEGRESNHVIFTGWCLFVPRVLARVVAVTTFLWENVAVH